MKPVFTWTTVNIDGKDRYSLWRGKLPEITLCVDVVMRDAAAGRINGIPEDVLVEVAAKRKELGL